MNPAGRRKRDRRRIREEYVRLEHVFYTTLRSILLRLRGRNHLRLMDKTARRIRLRMPLVSCRWQVLFVSSAFRLFSQWRHNHLRRQWYLLDRPLVYWNSEPN